MKSELPNLDVPWSLNKLQRAATIIVPGIDPIDVPDELIGALRRAIARGA